MNFILGYWLIQSKNFENSWKITMVLNDLEKNPVHKRREKKKMENYTAVSLTSFLRIKKIF